VTSCQLCKTLMMKISQITAAAAYLLALAWPVNATAQNVPLPGKWEMVNTFFVFDDSTKAYQPFMVQGGDDAARSGCFDANYFAMEAFTKPMFVTKQDERPGLQCVISDEGLSDSTRTWRQVCTDPEGLIEDDLYSISLTSTAIAIESHHVSKSSSSSGLIFRKSKGITKFKRLGNCD
jgi:hypothetical protein